MKLTSTAASALVAFLALTPITVFASLKHTDHVVFQQLADLTRPDHLKHHPNQPFGSLEQSSLDLPYQRQGVDWKVTKHQYGGISQVDSNGQTLSQQKSADFHRQPGLEPILANGKTAGEQAGLAAFALGQAASDDHPSSEKRAGSSSASSFYPIKPPSFPLAVRSPYLNAWAPAGQYLNSTPPNHVGNGGYLAGADASFWTSKYGAPGDYRLGWHGFIRVDNTSYQWLGDAFGNTVREGPHAKQISVEYTSTRTIYQFEANGVAFNVTFMTPIWPHDFVRQSIPMSYLHFEVDAESLEKHSVQMFVDIDERWVSAHVQDFENYPIEQSFDDVRGVQQWLIKRKNPQVYKEFRQRAEWGSIAWAARDRPALYARNNNDVVTQLEFLTEGKLTNARDTVAGPDNSFAYAVDFDSKRGGNDAVFAIGHLRTPYVNYIRADGKGGSYQEDRYGLWAANFSSFQDVVTFFVDDFENALNQSKKLDAQVLADSRAVVGGGKIGDEYAAITQLSVRQAMATIEWTISKTHKGKWNTSDVLIFLKEISSNGDMSTVDVFFPQFPLLTYLNPEILRLVMMPIFEYTESGLYPNKWCVHDLGTYPNAKGYNDGNDEPMQVEESGNMILLVLHWAQLVGDKVAIPFLKKHYRIMAQWAEFLVQDSLIPASQLSTDDFAGVLANQTNLAIKGIEGIAAMGVIADKIGRTTNASYYQNVSESYIKQWVKFALSKDQTHTKLAYQDDDSWGTLYNLFGDRLLNLQLVPEKIYDVQDAWYPKVVEQWGVPLDSRHNWTKSDWQMFASAITSSNKTRDLFISRLYDFYANGRTDGPMTDLYEANTGDFPKQPQDPLIYFEARPVVGGHFMHLALAKADQANNVTRYHYGGKAQQQQSLVQTGKQQRPLKDGDREERLSTLRKGPLRGLLPMRRPGMQVAFEVSDEIV